MEIVLDTASLQHLVRKPKRSASKNNKSKGAAIIGTRIDDPIQRGRLSLALDAAGGLESEWQQTCGSEIVKVLITKWTDHGGVRLIQKVGSINPHINKALRIMLFEDTIDKLILRIAISTDDKKVVSDDPDFWDPTNRKNLGKPNAPVAQLCRMRLGVDVLRLRNLVQVL